MNTTGKLPTFVHYEASTGQVQWGYQKPRKFHLIGPLKWRHGQNETTTLKVSCSPEWVSEAMGPGLHLPCQEPTYPLGWMKSLLQKSVRQNQLESGLYAAVQIMLSYPNGLVELLRRASIIMIEDSVLNQDMGSLVWHLMAFSIGMIPRARHLNELLEIIAGMLETRLQDHAYQRHLLTHQTKLPTLIYSIQQSKKGTEDHHLLWSLLSRKTFGGSSSELVMIDKVVALWIHRWHQKSNLLQHWETRNWSEERLDYRDYRRLPSHLILLDTIDQHCSSLCRELDDKFGIGEEVIEEMVWRYRSSVSQRPEIHWRPVPPSPEPYRGLWTQISPMVDLQAQQILEDYLEKKGIED